MISKDKVDKINELQDSIVKHGKIPLEVLKKINYKLRLEWNYTSNSMEGNTLTRDETRSVMIGNIDVHNKPIKDVIEMKGHNDVISKIMEIGKGTLNLSEGRIRDIHKAIMHEENPELAKSIGIWKTKYNQIINYKGEKFDFTPPAEVAEQMHLLINWLNTEKEKIERGDKSVLHPAEIAFKFHLDFVTIHPFYDGNGRTARIFTNLILIAYGFPPVYVKTSERDQYHAYLGDIQGYGGSPDLFYDFMAGLLIRSLQITFDAIEGKDIEEKDDVDKEIEMFKRELMGNQADKVPISKQILVQVLKESILPFFSRIKVELAQFEEMFLHNNATLELVVQGGLSISLKLSENSLSEIEKEMSDDRLSLTDIYFHYNLNGFLFGKEGKNQLIINFLVHFDPFMVVFNFRANKNSGRTEINTRYDIHISETNVDFLIKEIKKEVLEQVKQLSGQNEN